MVTEMTSWLEYKQTSSADLRHYRHLAGYIFSSREEDESVDQQMAHWKVSLSGQTFRQEESVCSQTEESVCSGAGRFGISSKHRDDLKCVELSPSSDADV